MPQYLFWKTSTFATKQRNWLFFQKSLFTQNIGYCPMLLLSEREIALVSYPNKVKDLHIFFARTDLLFGESRTTDWVTGCLFTVQGCLRLVGKALFCLLRSALILCNALATWDESYSFLNWNWLKWEWVKRYVFENLIFCNGNKISTSLNLHEFAHPVKKSAF